MNPIFATQLTQKVVQLAGSSIGEDSPLSRGKDGFDSRTGYEVLFSKIIIVLENNKNPTQLGRFLFLQVLKLGIQNRLKIPSKFIQTGS